MTYKIEAKTQTLCDIFCRNYLIPVYQRPYSWGEKQIRTFMQNLIDAYRDKEQVFLGTVLLSMTGDDRRHIIDGQQRLSSFLVLLKALTPEIDDNLKEFIETQTNGGEQQKLLESFIGCVSIPESDEKQDESRYMKNAALISGLVKDETEESGNFKVDDFISFIFHSVYFVTIETDAGLSQTLKIFDTINTTGLDLNGGDIFKIRMYDYLTSIEKVKDVEAFKQIDEIYALIETKNKETDGKPVTDIRGILAIYQFILIGKCDLPAVLLNMATDTFFERYFETLLGINKWENFDKDKVGRISLEDLKSLIKVRFDWELKWRDYDYGSVEDAARIRLWQQSRYRKYWTLVFVYLFKNPDRYDKLFDFTKKMTNVYLFYSIYYKRVKNNIRTTFTKQVIAAIFKDTDCGISKIEGKLQDLSKKDNDDENYEKLEERISGNVFDNATRKNLLCRIHALLAENHGSKEWSEIKRILGVLFNQTELDIEHIHARNNSTEEWEEILNSIGNLMVLERTINRSIQDGGFGDKKEEYAKSKLSVVQSIAGNSDWTPEMCFARKQSAVREIMAFLCLPNDTNPEQGETVTSADSILESAPV